MAKRYGMEYRETSAKNGIGVKDTFVKIMSDIIEDKMKREQKTKKSFQLKRDSQNLESRESSI